MNNGDGTLSQNSLIQRLFYIIGIVTCLVICAWFGYKLFINLKQKLRKRDDDRDTEVPNGPSSEALIEQTVNSEPRVVYRSTSSNEEESKPGSIPQNI